MDIVIQAKLFYPRDSCVQNRLFWYRKQIFGSVVSEEKIKS
jgi:hypothetical protein